MTRNAATDVRIAPDHDRTGPPSPWPHWARPQLLAAAGLASAPGSGVPLSTRLYREWFTPATDEVRVPLRPLAGVYRAAHAGSARREQVDGIGVVRRRDVLGRDGWWRTWGECWPPPRVRRRGQRVLFSPRPDELAGFVAALTGAMLDTPRPWLLACASDPVRLARSGAAVLYLPDDATLPPDLLAALAPTLRADVAPLCLPIAPGAALAEYPGNGMTFGEHRCHLIALALADDVGDPMTSIARVFAAHGIDPAAPYRSV